MEELLSDRHWAVGRHKTNCFGVGKGGIGAVCSCVINRADLVALVHEMATDDS